MTGRGPIRQAIGGFVDVGQLAGAATLSWRADQEAQVEVVGWRDIEARFPVERDTIFRIASMSKPITSVRP